MKPLRMTTPTPTSTRIVRSFDAPVALVWRAHTEPELVKRWMTGPEDHDLVHCDIDFRVGGKACRFLFQPETFGFFQFRPTTFFRGHPGQRRIQFGTQGFQLHLLRSVPSLRIVEQGLQIAQLGTQGRNLLVE